ncbi:Secretion protein HlyD [Sphingomonas aurantiaca]|jgi:adhesin transport system membrane fusion protein|uniref:Membrane fusion protein (MFP) family protein n=1 Tax=Sphingomonas aurantiaca TaxID=185949 RepID=A0A5E7XVV8_9SPHN|nr:MULTISPECIES: HlyD family type I secretion periplasmic adaptor subunit [Sphingomonas]KQN07393.1 secretion protein HlyD [Sphingomonas sp. Leaf28]VVS98284.1 Secretion protein HlyD [Sphingomonas aurantiaca]
MSDTHLEDLADRIKPKAVSNLLLWLIIGFIVVFIAWASIVKLDRTVHAPGRVVPSSRLQVLSNFEGGVVSAILVHVGDLVKRGQPLVRLDQTQAGAEFGSSEITVGALNAKIARLQAEIAGREPVYPAAATPEVGQQIGIERSLHAARMSDLASLSAAGAARAAQAERAVAEARSAYASRVSARDSAKRQLEMIRPLVDRGIEPQLTLIQLENSAAVAGTDAAQASAAIARAQSAVAEARASLAQVRSSWRAQAGTDLAAAQSEMASRQRSMPALAAKLGRSTVASPVDGRVNRVLVSTVGSSIGAGQPIVEVVPSAETLTVEALVSPKDIAAVRIGQRARVNITAYESGVYGGMDGRVLTISPDATVEERTGESHYTVRVRADAQNFRGPEGQRLVIGPGMTADVNLIGDKRSIMAYILTPFTRLREEALRE